MTSVYYQLWMTKDGVRTGQGIYSTIEQLSDRLNELEAKYGARAIFELDQWTVEDPTMHEGECTEPIEIQVL